MGSEAREAPANTVRREVREETGLDVRPVRMTGIYYERAADLVHFAFACECLDNGQPRASDSEVDACGFFAPDALPRPMSDFTVRRICDAINGRRTMPSSASPSPTTK